MTTGCCHALLGIAPVLAAVTSVGCTSVPVPADLVIENVTIYSGAELEPFRGTVAVRDGGFVAVDRESRLSFRAAETVDGEGMFLMPGLWDMHVHLRASDERGLAVGAFVAHGVTSIRDLGGYREQIQAVETEMESGAVIGPNVYSAYTILNGQVHADFQRAVTTEQEVVAAIDDLAAAGAIQIKVHRALAPELLPEVLSEAHGRGLAVTGHIPLGVHPLEACELGMDGVEHVGSFLEAYVSVTPGATSASAIDYMLSEAADPLYACLVARAMEVTPTLVVYPAVARSRTGGDPVPQDHLDFIAAMGRIALRLHRSGVTLLGGTDASDLGVMDIPPGASLLDELELLQQAGIPAREIVRISTSNAARTLGLDPDTGSIEVGKVADFILLSGDPGESIAHVRDLVAVYRGGRRIGPAGR